MTCVQLNDSDNNSSDSRTHYWLKHHPDLCHTTPSLQKVPNVRLVPNSRAVFKGEYDCRLASFGNRLRGTAVATPLLRHVHSPFLPSLAS
jgi:hypothetical protein